MTIIMFDSVNVNSLPLGNFAYAGYVNGHWPTYGTLCQRFPNHQLLSIAVSSNADADCLDIERGDATNAVAPGWVNRQIARGLHLPVLYTSASNIDPLVNTLAAAGIQRPSYRLWSAHYGRGEHICGPGTCRACSAQCDGTQWTSTALGRSLDQSCLADNFFAPQIPMPEGTVNFTPALILEPICSQWVPPEGGVLLLAPSGAIYAWGGAQYRGGSNGKPYFVGRTAHHIEGPNAAEQGAGYIYIIVDTWNERYGYPETP